MFVTLVQLIDTVDNKGYLTWLANWQDNINKKDGYRQRNKVRQFLQSA